jgi:inhibitor of KinA
VGFPAFYYVDFMASRYVIILTLEVVYMANFFINPKIEPLGDKAVLVSFGSKIDSKTHHSIQSFLHHLTAHSFSWMIEAVPAYTNVAIYYDPIKFVNEPVPFTKIERDLEALIDQNTADFAGQKSEQVVRIPVCYGGKYGPDLLEVAKNGGMTPDEVIALHTQGDYLVHMIGFAPGFPYLGGMTEKLTTPRRETPLLKIPAGSVGIAGGQTGIYPLESPGGWQIIGRTPVPLFRPQHKQPSLLKAGDHVHFYPISSDEFESWGGDGDVY